jgi:conjugative transfer signal peptidase TraF
MTGPRGWLIAAMLGGAGLAMWRPAARPLLVWNATASAPLGPYRTVAPDRLRAGDWALVRPGGRLAAWLDARGYLPAGALLVKRVAALPGQTVCRHGGWISIDGRRVARVRARDRRGRPLPGWRGCARLSAAQLFLLNAPEDSLDGRYFGPIGRGQVVARLAPLWPARGR